MRQQIPLSHIVTVCYWRHWMMQDLLIHKNTARKNIISFSKCFENMIFPKKSTGIWSFLYYQERWYFFFAKYDLILRHNMKNDLSQKNTWKWDIFFRCSGKMVFPGNSRLSTIFFVTSGKIVFIFSRKFDIFSLGGKWKKMIFI